MYVSPINMIIDDFQTEVVKEQENYICRAVQNVGIDVDKDELVKALMYDRNQYEKGYEDGLKANKWIPCSDCTLGEDDPTCLKCTKNVFDSIRNIINKQIAEEEK